MKKYLLIAVFVAACVSAKPVAIVNGGPYAGTDLKHIVYQTFAPNRIAYEKFTGKVSAAQLQDYAAVFFFSGAETYNPEEMKQLMAFVSDGGILVLTGYSPAGLTGRKYVKAGFPAFKQVVINRAGIKGGILLPEHPVFKGIDPENPPNFLTAGTWIAAPAPGTKVLAGTAEAGFFTETEVGKGKIYWLWEAALRMGKQDKDNYPGLAKIYANILEDCQNITKWDDQLRAKFPGKKLLLWQRDWQDFPEERPHFYPNYPLPGEELKQLQFFSAANECDTQYFVLQSTENVEIKIGQLKKPFQLLRMSKGAPMLSHLKKGQPKEWADAEGNYYLRNAPSELELLAGVPEVFAVRLDTAELQAGNLSDTLHFGDISIPVEAEIYPVAMPPRRPIEYRTWGMSPPLDFREIWRQNNINQAHLPVFRWYETKDAKTGMTLGAIAQKNPEYFASGHLGQLIIQDVHLAFIKKMVENNVTMGRVTDIRSASYAANALGLKEKLPAPCDYPEKIRTLLIDYYRQHAEFYASRGIYELAAFPFDEPDLERIKSHVIPTIKLLKEAGIRCGASWTVDTLRDPEVAKILAPDSYWGCYTVILHQFEALCKNGTLDVPAAAPRGYYIGSTPETRRPFGYGRTYAHYFFSLGQEFTFAHVGPAWKEWLYYGCDPIFGVWGQRTFAYGDPEKKTLLTCAFVEGIRDGLDDSCLNWFLTRSVKRLQSFANSDAALNAVLAKIRAHQARRLTELKFHPVKRGPAGKAYEYMAVGENLPPVRAERFKKEILDELVSMLPYLQKYLKPEITWRGIDLSEGAKIVGGTLEGVMNNPQGTVTIRLDTDNVRGNGDYRIDVSPDKKTVSVIGGDGAGLELGKKAFLMNLKTPDNWFMCKSR